MGYRGRRLRLGLVAALSSAVAGVGFFFGPAIWTGRGIDRARAAYARGDWESAAALATAELRRVPANRDALRLLARANARRGRADSARALYTRLGGAEAMQAEDFFLLGKAIDRAGDHQTARASWVAGLQLDPKNAEILNELTRFAREGGQLDVAEHTANALVQRPGWEARGELHLGRIAFDRDDPSSAVRHWERAFALDRTLRGAPEPSREYEKRFARALLRAGRADDAAKRLRSIVGTGGDRESAWLLCRAELLARQDTRTAAWSQASESYRADHPLEPEPAPYIGAERCGECHKEQYRAEQQSLHARTFQRGAAIASLGLEAHAVADPVNPAVKHTVDARARQLHYRTEDAGRTLAAIVEFAFGSGHRGMTLIGRDEAGRMRELRLSRYADGPCWDVTTGHPALPPSEEGFLGRILSSSDLESCFECHTTAPYPVLENRGPAAHDHGIGCERCHGPGGNHVAAVRAKATDLAIVQPRSGAGAGVVALCGQCHAPLRQEVRRDDPRAPRFPAVGLTWSRCYQESAGALDCRTCHDPHRDLATAPVQYERTCRTCHANSAPASVCPVNRDDGCISCHMPRTKITVPHAEFTDHHIRVHRRENQHDEPRTQPYRASETPAGGA